MSKPPAAESPKVLREMLAIARQGVLMTRPGRAYRPYRTVPELTVFVHGYFANSAIFQPMSAHLRARGLAGRQLHFSYAPTGTVEDLARRLDASIRAVQPHGPVHIVAHSLGGIIARYYRQVLGRPVDRMALLAAPHAGTSRAAPWRALPLLGEISPGSETLRVLHATRRALAGVRVCSVVALAEGVVLPAHSAALDEHEVIYVSDTGHQSMLFDRRVFATVERLLRDERVSTDAALSA